MKVRSNTLQSLFFCRPLGTVRQPCASCGRDSYLRQGMQFSVARPEYFVHPRRDRDDPRAVALLALGCLLCPSFCSLIYSKYLFASFLRGERSSTRPLKLSQEMESGHGTQDSTQKHGRTAEGEKQWRAAARRRNKEEGEEKDFFSRAVGPAEAHLHALPLSGPERQGL